ncbi:MAG TPA: 2-dehydro-3-deoxygalactonokinase [Povalibacter sp.]
MAQAAFIAGDWGTTNLRLSLCDATGVVLDSVTGPGVSHAAGRFETLFADLTSPWTERHGRLPAVLCGMVGSTIGWTNVPYVACPCAPERIADAMTALSEHAVHIAPGLSCRNRNQSPDVLRGEETQLLGAIRLQPDLARGLHLLCLPGTHTKWVVLEDGAVREFVTSVTGELFAVVNQHSVLVRGEGESADGDAAFQRAAEHVLQHPAAALPHLLFECRSRQVAGELTRADAPHFLSGLLIAHDVLSATRIFADAAAATSSVTLIGTPQLMRLHKRVLTNLRLRADCIDGTDASLAGLTFLYQTRVNKERASGT